MEFRDLKKQYQVLKAGIDEKVQEVSAAVEEGREPLVSGERGKKALDIILAIYESQKTGKAVCLPNNFSTLEMKGEFDK